MKHLMTLVALLVSTAAVAQIPTLPWNPDENGDQFIGLPDLLGLLTVYGQEFENAIVAEDGESAIMFTGNMNRHECEYACDNLSGFWTLPHASDLVPAAESINGEVWLWSSLDDFFSDGEEFLRTPVLNEDQRIRMTEALGVPKECYCTAKQLPRVEYSVCYGSSSSGGNSFDECCESKVQDGWVPLPGSPTVVAQYGYQTSQAFWRFAQ